eukprot:scaffold7295_cov167-Amphora_coffeaeformis.AAC.5
MFSRLSKLVQKKDDTADAVDKPVKYNFDRDSYQWPNLYQEADELMLLALLMYTFTDLRHLAKEGKLSDNASMLTLPVTLSTVLRTIQANQQAIEKEAAGHEQHEMAQSALESIQERYNTQSSTTGKSWLDSFTRMQNAAPEEPATLLAFGDENPDKELVYGVGIDHIRKRVTVAFRGSVTATDFFTDACIEFNRRENPLHNKNKSETEAAAVEGTNSQQQHQQKPTIGIHHGFDEYLLKRRKADGGECKYDEILKIVHEVFAVGTRREEYKLYVTGHSLGGALACLFAFEVAASDDSGTVPSPVTCVSVASPRVGDEAFQSAFSALEAEGKLRHLRIAHAQDPVTMMPKTSSKQILAMVSPIVFIGLAIKEALFTSNETYRHTGVKLRLFSNKSKLYEISYAGVTTVQEEAAQDNNEKQAEKQVKSSSGRQLEFVNIPGVSFHYGPTYTEQLAKCKEELSQKSLNKIYASLG